MKSGLAGAAVFAVLGTVGTIQRGRFMLPLPAMAHLVLGANRAASKEGRNRVWDWVKLPLATGIVGFWLSGYVGYSHWQMDKEQMRKRQQIEASIAASRRIRDSAISQQQQTT
eukprot:TRINITY_DN3575_c0_g1_i7.p2 TRINITY_DN3575_c0_g1~~TRINITY_DN3575_c0_g1_i7.p2  ORF type:complete len:113 (+),score=18.75 TRINITY_DN3575_c0_g1_i7:119-457(+)